VGACGDDYDDDNDDDNDDDTDDDDDNDDNNDTTDDDDDDDNDDDNDDETPPTDAIAAVLSDLLTGDPVVGATCELIKSSDGSSFDPPVTATTDSNGRCTFNQEAKGFFSVKFTDAAYVTSYAFNFDAAMEWYFSLVTPVARAGIAASLDVTLDDSKGIVTGAVAWYNPGTGAFAPVGCGVVTNDNASTIYYFNDYGLPVDWRTDTNPLNGLFLALNVPPGPDAFHADVDGAIESAEVPAVFADAIVFVDVFYLTTEYAQNPTPGGCD
jgi:5-hydroxyisourate hydrolase-like protein (transthyretin family)